MAKPSLLLVHGPASGAWIWRSWRDHLRGLGWQVNVLDLRGHGRSVPIDLSTVTMEDYVADLASVTVQIHQAQGVHPVVGGWSTGGMVAMMYADAHPETSGLLLFSPVAPVEVAGKAPIEVVRGASGEVLEPQTFGVYPEDAARSREALFDLTDEELDWFLSESKGAQEAGLAYRQGLRGISIAQEAIQSPALVVYGEAEAPESRDQGRALAEYLGGESLSVPAAGHWGIVCHDEAVAAAAPGVDAWLERHFA